MKSVKVEGYVFKDEKLFKITDNKTSKHELMALMGTPSSASFIGEETWYYISEQIKEKVALPREISDRKVLEVKLNNNGIVTSTKIYTNKDAYEVKFSRDYTKTLGDDNRLTKLLFGNIGRFNKEKKQPTE